MSISIEHFPEPDKIPYVSLTKEEVEECKRRNRREGISLEQIAKSLGRSRKWLQMRLNPDFAEQVRSTRKTYYTKTVLPFRCDDSAFQEKWADRQQQWKPNIDVEKVKELRDRKFSVSYIASVMRVPYTSIYQILEGE